jgi:predicted nucleic acid-binding protein
MSDKSFVDTNILVYANERAEGTKHALARELVENLWKTGSGAISTQVLQELCVSLRRKAARPASIEETQRLIEDYMAWHVVVNTAESIVEALAIESRYKISFWDALIVQAAGVSGAEILYSEDLSHGQSYGCVRVVNPLREGE